MKDINSLGISQWPWKRDATSACDSNGECVFNCCTWNENSIKDARLIAAAPELYECLREAFLVQCGMCMFKPCLKEKCAFKNWRDALAKASGESEEEQ